MAATPGFLTDWPWKALGSFKYLLLAPFLVKSIYDYTYSDASEKDLANLLIFPLIISRMGQNQIWSTISRYRTAKGKNRIIDKPIEFEQIDHENTWDDPIILNGIVAYATSYFLEGSKHMPFWRLDGVIIINLVHFTVVEFVYYWLHRALHHHFLYNRYHSHHHSFIVTQPSSAVVHPFAEQLAYYALFFIPSLIAIQTKTLSIGALAFYIHFVDLMNYMGHCNFEIIPQKVFSIFPPLKYIMYSPTFHSLHHTQFRTNYSLFVPFYDYVYGTMDINTDTLHEKSLQREEETPDVVFLTHLTTPESIYHMRVGFPSLASKPLTSRKWYLWMLLPLTILSMMISWIYGKTFVVERNVFKNIKIQSWVIPKYTIQYSMESQRERINALIEKAILDANVKGAKVLSLGLLNQGDELNRHGELFIRRNPELKLKLVDGSSLVVAVVLNSIPKGTTQVAFRGNLNKVAYSLAGALCHRGIQVVTSQEDDYVKPKSKLEMTNGQCKLVLSKSYSQKIWLAGDGLSKEEQLKASKGTLIIPYSKFPPEKVRKDCFYYMTPAMLTPKSLKNVDSCENWLPRRVMSAWRVAGILHALEEWKVNECGTEMFKIDEVWQVSLKHGFAPVVKSFV